MAASISSVFSISIHDATITAHITTFFLIFSKLDFGFSLSESQERVSSKKPGDHQSKNGNEKSTAYF